MAGIFGKQAAAAALFGCSLISAFIISTFEALAAELKVMSTVALTPALDELKLGFESNGNRLTIVYSTIAELKKRIDAGETADVIMLSRPVLDELARQGKVTEGSIVNIGMSYVAVGVRAGAPLPDISTAEKLKAALLATRSISYADPAKGGASGVYIAKVIDRLGIAEEMKPKTTLVPNAQAGELVARGEVEMGVAQASEIAAVPGTQVVGPLPGDLNSSIIFAIGAGSTSQSPSAAKALIELMTSPAALDVMKSKGMDPP
ncbi:MAG TPA: substrate-binding domain-containing protein [Bradyrhizobium sp.]|uniref:molybdate ABC transporter substrate-binding protein n=1 Tax=Bradyrhizobium sp. TaxID=376 RepID=UPI002D7E9D4C|nr:substrate-binding domain-containing protein [Bradyrhizobium sp.]HET7888893.1 substrate-binding domain-containing protein [Bradyrhizobium sp.]